VCVCVCGKQGGWKERELVIPKRLTEEHQQTWRAKLILFAQSLKTQLYKVANREAVLFCSSGEMCVCVCVCLISHSNSEHQHTLQRTG